MIWLLRFTYAGRDWLVASAPCTPEGLASDGTTAHYPHAAGLDEPEYKEAIDWAAGNSGPTEASVRFLLGGIDVARLVSEGHHLYMAEGELSLWAPGDSYDAREVLFTGRFFPGKIPFKGEPIEGKLYELAWERGEVWPPAAAVVDTVTWPAAAEGAYGKRYPYVLGKPGAYTADDGTSANADATPAYVVFTGGGGTTASTVLVCGTAVVASTVTLHNATDGTTLSGTVASATDGRGLAVSVVDVSGTGWASTDEIFVQDWGGGGIKSARATTCMETWGEVAEYLLRQRIGTTQAAARIDSASWRAAGDVADRVKIAGYFDETADPWAIYNSHLRQLMPALYVLGGPRGLRAVVVRDTPLEQCRAVTVGQELHRDADVRPEYDSGEGLTSFSVSFAPIAGGGEFQALATRDHDSDARAAATRSRLRGAVGDSIEAALVYSRASADMVASENMRIRWATAVRDRLWAPLHVGASIKLGERLAVTDDDAGHVDRLMWVVERVVADGRIGFGLLALW